MKKIILLFLIILTSCAGRHVQISKIDIKKDSVVETKVLVTTIESKEKTDSTNIITTIDNNEIIITPIDTCKEIIVDGKSYKNVVLKIKKIKTNTLYRNNKTESNIKQKDSIGISKTTLKETTIGKTKAIDKKANYWYLFCWLILILIIYLLWRNKRKLFNVL